MGDAINGNYENRYYEKLLKMNLLLRWWCNDNTIDVI